MTGRSALVLVLCGCRACLGSQPDAFTKPVRLEYGDPARIAPMMAPCLTLDWDRDGRADLCTSGGWWRHTGEERDGLPVFERTVGGAVRGLNVGDLDGDAFADVVVAGRTGRATYFIWYEDTTETGARKFVSRGKIRWAIGGDLTWPEHGEGHPSVSLADWDSDGRTDLLVGASSIGLDRYLPRKGPGFGVGWADNTWLFRDMTATVWFLRNVGPKDEPTFGAGNLVTTGETGRAITFFDKAIPFVADWDGDGKHDLVVGGFDTVAVFLNVGPAQGVPTLDDGRLLTFDGKRHFGYQRRWIFPFRGADGLWHIRFAGPTGSEAVQRSKRDLLAFGPLRMLPFRNPAMVLDTFTVPDAADWDGDGKIDIVVGCEDGWLWFFKNLDPKAGASLWAAPVQLEADGKPVRLDENQCLQGPCEWRWGYSNPTVADWDLDGDLDIVCGCTAETYFWFENVGTRVAPKLTARGHLRCGEGDGKPVSCAWRTRPGVGDVDGDSLPDLIGVAGSRQLCWWRREREAGGRLRLAAPTLPVNAAGEPFVITGAVRATGRTKLVVCDWDHDGRPDIISSPALGKRDYQLLFRNMGVQDGRLTLDLRPKQILVKGHIGKRWSHFAMCEPVDFDGDGIWEVLAGTDRGAMYYFGQ